MLELEWLCQMSSVVTMSTGGIVFTQGQATDFMYVLLEGKIGKFLHEKGLQGFVLERKMSSFDKELGAVQMTDASSNNKFEGLDPLEIFQVAMGAANASRMKNAKLTGTVVAGDCLGHIALSLSKAHDTTSVALQDLSLLKVSKEAFDRCLKRCQKTLIFEPSLLVRVLQQPHSKRTMMEMQQVTRLLHGHVRFFTSFPFSFVQRLLGCMQVRSLEAGEWLVKPGDPIDAFYVVCFGSVFVTVNVPGPDTLDVEKDSNDGNDDDDGSPLPSSANMRRRVAGSGIPNIDRSMAPSRSADASEGMGNVQQAALNMNTGTEIEPFQVGQIVMRSTRKRADTSGSINSGDIEWSHGKNGYKLEGGDSFGDLRFEKNLFPKSSTNTTQDEGYGDAEEPLHGVVALQDCVVVALPIDQTAQALLPQRGKQHNKEIKNSSEIHIKSGVINAVKTIPILRTPAEVEMIREVVAQHSLTRLLPNDGQTAISKACQLREFKKNEVVSHAYSRGKAAYIVLYGSIQVSPSFHTNYQLMC